MNAASSSEPFDRFFNIVADRFGLALEPARLAGFSEVLDRLAAQSELNVERYVERLERSPSEEDLAALIQEITVSETYFFRHSQQFDALRALLASSFARGGGPGPSFLCAGCATGEEAFSIAITLREALPLQTPSIVAVDLNPASLACARQGRFTAWALRETPPVTRDRWFRQEGKAFFLDPAIRDSVRFRETNLATVDPLVFASSAYHVIFCRNVLMYFTPEQSRSAVARFHQALVPGGYLFLGSAETLRGLSHDFELCQEQGAFYYRKRPADGAAKSAGFGAIRSDLEPRQAPTRAPRVFDAELEAETEWARAIGRAADRVRALSSAKPSRAAVGASLVASATREEPARPAAFGQRADLREPLELLCRERFDEALSRVRELSSVDGDVMLLEAVLLSSGARLDEARSACHRLLAVDELNAGAHYVLALCEAATGALDEAVRHHRIAIYLDPHFAMPRLQLGLLFRRMGERAQARRELLHASSLLQHEDAARLTLFGGGFGRSALLGLCASELAATQEDA